MPAKIILVTGTDTGVGKTVVTAGLTLALNSIGISTIAVKPAETGCVPEINEHEDGTVLWEASGNRGWHGALYRLPEPLAPAVTADNAGIEINIDHIIKELRVLENQCEYLIVEGAGGLLVPITWKVNYLDLALMLNAQILIVGRAGLGTINHTLLTYKAIERAGVKIVGIVLSSSTEMQDPSVETNAKVITRLTGNSNILELPYLSGNDIYQLMKEASKHLLPLISSYSS
jgi:dethiobiotin synthetase